MPPINHLRPLRGRCGFKNGSICCHPLSLDHHPSRCRTALLVSARSREGHVSSTVYSSPGVMLWLQRRFCFRGRVQLYLPHGGLGPLEHPLEGEIRPETHADHAGLQVSRGHDLHVALVGVFDQRSVRHESNAGHCLGKYHNHCCCLTRLGLFVEHSIAFIRPSTPSTRFSDYLTV